MTYQLYSEPTELKVLIFFSHQDSSSFQEAAVLVQMPGNEFSHTYCSDIDGHIKRKGGIEVEELS